MFVVGEVAVCISNDFYAYIFDREVCLCLWWKRLQCVFKMNVYLLVSEGCVCENV